MNASVDCGLAGGLAGEYADGTFSVVPDHLVHGAFEVRNESLWCSRG
jgi:hypothetical protein